MATQAKETMRAPEPGVPDARKTDAALELTIEGMTCASCVRRVERKLERVPGVENAQVNLATEQAAVRYDPRRTGVDALIEAVARVFRSRSVPATK